MDDRSRVALSALVGAVLGGAIGYVLFTERGARIRAQYQPQLDGLLDDALHLQGSMARLGGWGSLASVFGGLGRHRDDRDGERQAGARPH